jgi:hypothetical protein
VKFQGCLIRNTFHGKKYMKTKGSVCTLIVFICFAFFACNSHTTGETSFDTNVRSGKVADFKWEQDYIAEIPPIRMKDPLFEILGQTNNAIPYTYEEAVKLTGHSFMLVAAAWSMTRKALDALYPNGETPVRGQISIRAPGAEKEWNLGIFGQVMTYVTSAATGSGFSGSGL